MEPVNGSRQGFYLANVIRNLYMSVDIQTTGTAGNFNMKKCCVCQICVSELQLLFFSIMSNRRQWCVICSCLGCIQWMVYVFVSVFNPPHTHTCSAREWSEANVCSWSKCKWNTMLSVMVFFFFFPFVHIWCFPAHNRQWSTDVVCSCMKKELRLQMIYRWKLSTPPLPFRELWEEYCLRAFCDKRTMVLSLSGL